MDRNTLSNKIDEEIVREFVGLSHIRFTLLHIVCKWSWGISTVLSIRFWPSSLPYTKPWLASAEDSSSHENEDFSSKKYEYSLSAHLQ